MEGQRFYFFSGQLFFIGGRKRTRQGRPFTSTTPQALELKRTQNRRRRKKNERRTCRLHDRVSSGSETKGQRLFFPFFAFASLPFYFFPFCLPVSVYDSWYFANGQSKKHIQSTSCRQCNCTDEFTVSDEKNVRRWATSECFRKLKIPPRARTIAPKQGEKKNNFTRNQHNNPYVPGQKKNIYINTNKINTRCNAMRVDCTAVAFRLTCRVYVCVCVCLCSFFSPLSFSNFTQLMLVHWPAVPRLCQRTRWKKKRKKQNKKRKKKLGTTSQQNSRKFRREKKKKRGDSLLYIERPWLQLLLCPVSVQLFSHLSILGHSFSVFSELIKIYFKKTSN